MYISLLMGERGFARREASPKEVLAHGLRLAQEVAPPTPKASGAAPGATATPFTWPSSFTAPSSASPTARRRPHSRT
jgi:hypothetical protein